MCSHYLSISTPRFLTEAFNVSPPKDLGRADMWPGYMGLFIRRPEHSDVGDDAVPEREAVLGRWGLIPHWSKDGKERNTFNARSETAMTKPSFRDAWGRGQRCIIPAAAVFEPDWRSGKSIPTQISRTDNEPLGIAGLWSAWKSSDGWIDSYTMLTVNAEQHELMRNFHKPGDERRMVVILHEDQYGDWLGASTDQAKDLMQRYTASLLQANAATSKPIALF